MPKSGPAVQFTCDKRPASGTEGVVVTNNPNGTAAGAEILAAGGNAVDAAVAALLALTVAEPMMVGIAGGGVSHLRLPDGRHVVVDALSTAPAATGPETFEPVSDDPDHYMDTRDRRNEVGPSAVAVPGNLAGWCLMQEKYGRLPFADVIDPAIRIAERGFTVTPYLFGTIREHADDLRKDTEIASLLFQDGEPAAVGSRMVRGDYAESLRLFQKDGPKALYGGALGQALVDRIATGGKDAGFLSIEDLQGYRAIEREAIFGPYRGYTIVGPPPPASSGVHVTEMLNILEGYDIRGMRYGTPETLHLLSEVIRIAFEDRNAASGDPDFIDVPVDLYTSKSYAAEARSRMRDVGGALPLPEQLYESQDTTHVTVADRDGGIVSATHTINGLFGARFMVPGTGIIPNNYMLNYDPRPGKARSVAPGKRVPTSMAPMIVLKDGQPAFALGLPGGVRIFPSAMQAIVNLIDHGMSLQEAVEAPRLWTGGHHIDLEPGYAELTGALEAMGHEVRAARQVGGGMNAIGFGDDGVMTGAACWRADGTVMAIGGGLARKGARFQI
ncbi:gamma-glutamyltransferase [Pseudoruegeria sp. HB172150]|uniref:gamma-glutamyltransferase n=1 Tax=Pseudoruegeria sp. HB172150 TaxID=2721164 RepID=UPI001553505C|nr:gamma-glutamyltransferase [Pseudoruegeria sp. HB172150]